MYFMTRFKALLLLTFGFTLLPHTSWAEPQTRPAMQAAAGSAQATPKEPPTSDTRKVLVVFGDSISAGYGLRPGQSYPDVLQRRINGEKLAWRVVNMGISGDTTPGGVARMNTVAPQRPSVVLLELGGNDGLRGMPLASTRTNLEKMITGFQAMGARVVLAGMTLPPNYGPDYVSGFERIYADLAAKYKLALIPFILADIVTPDLHFFQPDRIHPTAEGAEIVSSTVLKTLKPLLGRN
jgi:acyl-CoA thioesterase I